MSEIELPLCVHVFFSYAYQDQALRNRLEDHLSLLKYRGFITTWHAKQVNAGQNVLDEIDIHLNTAHLILLLVSANFLASEYCFGRELQRALERHEQRTAHVVPILLRPVSLTGAPFAHLQALPPNGKPITQWKNREQAFMVIALKLEQLIEHLRKGPPFVPPALESKGGVGKTWLLKLYAEEWYREEVPLAKLLDYYPAILRSCKQALQRNPTNLAAYRGKAHALRGLQRYEEAIQTYQDALSLSPEARTYVGLGDAYAQSARYPEAIIAYQNALQLDPTSASAYEGLYEIHSHLSNVREAQQVAQEAAIQGYEIIYNIK